MPTDAFEMGIVHRTVRRELTRAPGLISRVQPGQPARQKLVASHIANVISALHHHHTAEDERLWPILHARIPMHSHDIVRMQGQHEQIANSMARVELRLSEWLETTDSMTPRRDAWSRTTGSLIADLEALAELVSDHLRAEEELMVPLINAHITEPEWRAVTQQGGSFINRNMWFVLAFLGMALEACTPDERRRFLAGMPRPHRLLARLFARRALAGYRARLEGRRSTDPRNDNETCSAATSETTTEHDRRTE